MKNLLPFFLSIALFSGGYVYAAHAKLLRSTPADSSVSDAPPSACVLEFSEAVALHEAYLKKDNDKQSPVRDLPHNDGKTQTIPLRALTAGHYVLEWSVFTHDSIALSGRIRFTVSAESVAASSSTQ